MNTLRKIIPMLCYAVLLCTHSTFSHANDNDSQCIHWHNSFVFTEFMDRAKVTGDKDERLYFYKPHPDLCESHKDCKQKSYLIPKDEVTIGNVCRQWAFVEFRSKREKRTEGWVELNRLSMQQPDTKSTSRSKSNCPLSCCLYPILGVNPLFKFIFAPADIIRSGKSK